MILLDSHVLVWLDQGSDLLGRRARRTIEQAFVHEEIGIATVTFWEIGRLITQGRLKFEGDLAEWRVSLINSGFTEFPVDGVVALTAATLTHFEGDPADRMITATAVAEEARLVTADQRLLSQRGLKTINGMN